MHEFPQAEKWNEEAQFDKIDPTTKDATLEICPETTNIMNPVSQSLEATPKAASGPAESQTSQICEGTKKRARASFPRCVPKWERAKNMYSNKEHLLFKSVLRCIRKYFLKKFQAANPKIVRRRVKNVSTKELLDGLSDTLKELRIPDNEGQIAEFLFIILGLKSSYKLKFDEAVERRANVFVGAMNNFSFAKMEEIIKMKELHLLVDYVCTTDYDALFCNKSLKTSNLDSHKSVIEFLRVELAKTCEILAPLGN